MRSSTLTWLTVAAVIALPFVGAALAQTEKGSAHPEPGPSGASWPAQSTP
jgi:hypothetical protein